VGYVADMQLEIRFCAFHDKEIMNSTIFMNASCWLRLVCVYNIHRIASTRGKRDIVGLGLVKTTSEVEVATHKPYL